MHFAFTDEQAMIAETARSFFAENATSQRTRAAMAADGIDARLWTAFCQELALSGIGIPESAGGAGLGMIELAIIAEAAGAEVAALPMLGSLAMAAQAIAAGGSAAQQGEWLPGLLSGATIAGYVHDAALKGMLKPEFEEVELGTAEIREIFRSSKFGNIAGSIVRSGEIRRGARARITRHGVVVAENVEVAGLRRFKDDVVEVREGYECGINLGSFNDLQLGDLIATYEMREKPRA